MQNSSLQSELTRFVALPPADQVLWLSRLIHALTIAARDTYETGTEEIAHPTRLRSYNELIHRVAGFQRDVILDSQDRFPAEIFTEMLKDSVVRLRVGEDWLVGTLRK